MISLVAQQLTAGLRMSLTLTLELTLGKSANSYQRATRSAIATQQLTSWWTGKWRLVMTKLIGLCSTRESTWLATQKKICSSTKSRRNSVKRVTHLLGALIQIFTERLGSKVSVSSESYKLAATAVEVTTWRYRASKCMEKCVTVGGLESKVIFFLKLNS